jgi:hypothetical protein
MTLWGRVEDLPQVEGCETLKAGRLKQGTKIPKKQPEKERKARENKKTKESGEGEPSRGEGKGKGETSGLEHQVN